MKKFIIAALFIFLSPIATQAKIECEILWRDSDGVPISFCEDEIGICLIYKGRHIAFTNCALKSIYFFSNPNLDPKNKEPKLSLEDATGDGETH